MSSGCIGSYHCGVRVRSISPPFRFTAFCPSHHCQHVCQSVHICCGATKHLLLRLTGWPRSASWNFAEWPKIAISLRTCAHQCGEVSDVGSQVVDGRHQCSTQRMRGGNATFSQQHQTHPRRTIHDVWFQAPAGETRDEKNKRSQFWGLTEHFKAKVHIS